jgi:hypothetical protein
MARNWIFRGKIMKTIVLLILLTIDVFAYEEWLLLGTSEDLKIDYSNKNIKEVWSYNCYDELCWVKNPEIIPSGNGYWIKIENYKKNEINP